MFWLSDPDCLSMLIPPLSHSSTTISYAQSLPVKARSWKISLFLTLSFSLSLCLSLFITLFLSLSRSVSVSLALLSHFSQAQWTANYWSGSICEGLLRESLVGCCWDPPEKAGLAVQLNTNQEYQLNKIQYKSEFRTQISCALRFLLLSIMDRYHDWETILCPWLVPLVTTTVQTTAGQFSTSQTVPFTCQRRRPSETVNCLSYWSERPMNVCNHGHCP